MKKKKKSRNNLLTHFDKVFGVLGIVNLETVILNNFDDTHASGGSAPCLTTVEAALLTNDPTVASQQQQQQHSHIIGSNNIHNTALAMSQLGTVYATKRRRRNGKR